MPLLLKSPELQSDLTPATLHHQSLQSVWSQAYLVILKLEWAFCQQLLYWQQQTHPNPAFNCHLPMLGASELSIDLPGYQITPWLGFIRYLPGAKRFSWRYQKPYFSIFYRRYSLHLKLLRQRHNWQLSLSTEAGTTALTEKIPFSVLYRELDLAH